MELLKMEIVKLPFISWEDLLLSLAIDTQQMCMAIDIAIDGKLM